MSAKQSYYGGCLTAVCLAASALLLGCSTVNGWLGRDDDGGYVKGPPSLAEPFRNTMIHYANLGQEKGQFPGAVKKVKALKIHVEHAPNKCPGDYARGEQWSGRRWYWYFRDNPADRTTMAHEPFHAFLFAVTGDADGDHSERKLAREYGVPDWR